MAKLPAVFAYEPPPQPPQPAFSNSMDWGNYPGGEPPNAGAADNRDGMGPERTASKSDGDSGMVTPPSTSDFPRIPDPHAPPGYPDSNGGEQEIADYGLNEKVEVGHSGGVQTYGLKGD